jgi:hypothetical protein
LGALAALLLLPGIAAADEDDGRWLDDEASFDILIAILWGLLEEPYEGGALLKGALAEFDRNCGCCCGGCEEDIEENCIPELPPLGGGGILGCGGCDCCCWKFEGIDDDWEGKDPLPRCEDMSLDGIIGCWCDDDDDGGIDVDIIWRCPSDILLGIELPLLAPRIWELWLLDWFLDCDFRTVSRTGPQAGHAGSLHLR